MIYKSIYKSKTSKLILNRFVRLTVASVFGLSSSLWPKPPRRGRCHCAGFSVGCRCRSIKGYGHQVGTINIEQAIFLSNQGQRDFAELAKNLSPSRTTSRPRPTKSTA